VTAQEKNYQVPFAILGVLVFVAMLGWVISYGFVNHALDKCNQDLQARLNVVKARLDSTQKALEHSYETVFPDRPRPAH
jgi:hypothetical protein